MHNSGKELAKANPGCADNRKVAIENGMRFEIISNEGFIRFKIDDCLIDSTGTEKCDYGFLRLLNDDFYFTELKGSEVEKAYSQIVSTIVYFDKNLLKTPKEKRYGFIVSSKVPKAGVSVQNLKQDFAKKYGRLLEVKNKVLQYHPK